LLCRTCAWQVKIKKVEKSSKFFFIFLDYNPFFYVCRGRKTQKNQKNFFSNYFLLYLVAIIVIFALYTKNIHSQLFAVESTESVLTLTPSINWTGEVFKVFLLQILFINIVFCMCVQYKALDRIALKSQYHRSYVSIKYKKSIIN
jgi:hypothetical protein